MEYLFAPMITVGKLDYLQILIEVCLSEFTELYPSRPLTPKMHYLIHMPTWTKRQFSAVVKQDNNYLISAMYVDAVLLLDNGACDMKQSTNIFLKRLHRHWET